MQVVGEEHGGDMLLNEIAACRSLAADLRAQAVDLEESADFWERRITEGRGRTEPAL